MNIYDKLQREMTISFAIGAFVFLIAGMILGATLLYFAIKEGIL